MTKRQKEELTRLREIASDAQNKIAELEVKEHVERGKLFVGKFFKYRNCYSCPESPSDYWWLYVAVVGIDDRGWLKLLKFQIDNAGRIEINTGIARAFDGYQPITANEFCGAWLDLQKQIRDISVEFERML